jgi:hypothetical protein
MSPAAACVAAWLVPGAGHLLLGRMRQALILFVTLGVMFVLGVAFGGRLFPLQTSEPLVFLAALGQWTLGVPRVVGALLGYGEGDVIRATYEYGNTFLIVGGLLNGLAVLDAFDLASGRKPV